MICWSDNNPVTCAINFDSVLPANTIQSRMARKPDKVNVSQPRVIANYIKGMDGVDLMDRLLYAAASYKRQKDGSGICL